MVTSPSSRSLKRLRELGFRADPVERWLIRPFQVPECQACGAPCELDQQTYVLLRRKDYLAIIDIIAIKGDVTLAVQATSGTNVAARLAKALASTDLVHWLMGRGREFEVWGWIKSARSRKWELRRRPLTLSDLERAGYLNR